MTVTGRGSNPSCICIDMWRVFKNWYIDIYIYINIYICFHIIVYLQNLCILCNIVFKFIHMMFLPRTVPKKNPKSHTIWKAERNVSHFFSWKVSSFETWSLVNQSLIDLVKDFFYPPWNDLTYPLPLNPGTFWRWWFFELPFRWDMCFVHWRGSALQIKTVRLIGEYYCWWGKKSQTKPTWDVKNTGK